MGIVLKVTPEVLKQTATAIESKIRDIQDQFEVIDTEIGRTRSFWEGDASDTHMSQYDGQKDAISESVSRLKNHPVNLMQMAGVYTETEAQLQEAALSLPEDVIV